MRQGSGPGKKHVVLSLSAPGPMSRRRLSSEGERVQRQNDRGVKPKRGTARFSTLTSRIEFGEDAADGMREHDDADSMPVWWSLW